MTEGQIKFNYQKAMGQASELKSIASSLSKLSSNSLNNNLSNIAKHWTGDNSNAYVKKGNTLKGKISTSASNISSAAATLEEMAGNIYRAEMAALRAAQTRSNK